MSELRIATAQLFAPACRDTTAAVGTVSTRKRFDYIWRTLLRNAGSYGQALAALRYLLRWVLKRGDLVEDILAPRPERRPLVVLSVDEVWRLFAAIVSFKNRMTLMTAYSARLA